jgi:hypothetical protein
LGHCLQRIRLARRQGSSAVRNNHSIIAVQQAAGKAPANIRRLKDTCCALIMAKHWLNKVTWYSP